MIWLKSVRWYKKTDLMTPSVLESPTARCFNFRFKRIVQLRNRRDVGARKGSVGSAVAARGRKRSATAVVPAMETVVNKVTCTRFLQGLFRTLGKID